MLVLLDQFSHFQNIGIKLQLKNEYNQIPFVCEGKKKKHSTRLSKVVRRYFFLIANKMNEELSNVIAQAKGSLFVYLSLRQHFDSLFD